MSVQLELRPESSDAPWVVHTDVFDGPLDLLLYLVKRDGIDLREVSVSRIAQSYLEFIDRMRELQLSIAADYLVMATTLIHLKSLDLLPRPPRILEEEEDPRQRLLDQLEAYQKAKHAAAQLEERSMLGRDRFVREGTADIGVRAVDAGVDAFGLLDLYWDLLKRSKEPEPTVKFEVPRGPDLESCCKILLSAASQVGQWVELSSILMDLPTRADRVVTFLAALEMTRLRWFDLQQSDHLAAIRFERLVPDDAVKLELVVGFDPAEQEEDQLSLPLRLPEVSS